MIRTTRYPAKGASGLERRHMERGAAPVEDADRKLRLAQSASELLASPAFDDVMSTLYSSAHDTLMNSALGDEGQAVRTVAHYKIRTLDMIHEKLRAMVEDAKFLPMDTVDSE